MTNEQIMKDFINGDRYYYGANHLLIDGNRLYNYSTCLCEIDRKTGTAKFNSEKYSTTTSKIQSKLFYLLQCAGFDIEETSFRFGGWWNYGYQGAPNYKANGKTR